VADNRKIEAQNLEFASLLFLRKQYLLIVLKERLERVLHQLPKLYDVPPAVVRKVSEIFSVQGMEAIELFQTPLMKIHSKTAIFEILNRVVKERIRKRCGSHGLAPLDPSGHRANERFPSDGLFEKDSIREGRLGGNFLVSRGRPQEYRKLQKIPPQEFQNLNACRATEKHVENDKVVITEMNTLGIFVFVLSGGLAIQREFEADVELRTFFLGQFLLELLKDRSPICSVIVNDENSERITLFSAVNVFAKAAA